MTHRKGFPAKCVLAVSAAVLILSATVHSAQEPIVFPSKGQSNEQMDSDKYACYSWAKGQTGFDPMQVPTATAPPPEAKGGLVKGAAGGALLGLAVGAVAGDAKKGAAIGGISGGSSVGPGSIRATRINSSMLNNRRLDTISGAVNITVPGVRAWRVRVTR